MKKLCIVFAGLMLAFNFSSCKKVVGDGPMRDEVRDVSGFTGIDLRIAGDVYFEQAAQYKVEVRAQDEILRVLDTYVSGGRLVIKFENDVKVRIHDGVTVKVSGPDVTSLRVSGSGNINCSGAFATPSMEIDISGSGDINVADLTTDFLDATISGSGDVRVQSGSATEEQLKISGSGSIDLSNVAAKDVVSRTSGSGDIRVRVSNKLDVNIAGSGSVYYSGNPVINASISGSGKVKQQ